VIALKKYIHARWENSGPFAEYLEKGHTKQTAEKAGVQLKHKHTVVPHVIDCLRVLDEHGVSGYVPR
jgi:hypothetical protein